MLENNLIWTLDSYKDLHDQMLPPNTEHVYSYLESRKGQYPYTIFFGLQYILKTWLCGPVITYEKINEIEPIMHSHFGLAGQTGKIWDRSKWDYIVSKHGGFLPVEIKAVPEGSKIPVGNVLMTIENTDPKCAWLTNALETVLQQVWYPTTVCTRSYYICSLLRKYLKETAEENMQWLADFQLHDFGQRGVSCMEAAGIGGLAHLVNSKGSDTKMAIPYAINYYGADYKDLCFAVPASEHSIMCAEGKEEELNVVRRLCKQFPDGILSVVSDTYDIGHSIYSYGQELKNDILARNGKFVIRLDSPRYPGERPADQILWVANCLWTSFGGLINDKKFKVLDPKVGIIYGDSLTEDQIEASLITLKEAGFSTECCFYGCGGYLLQKVNRDTQSFAMKASAICRNGIWNDIYKKPKDTNKGSKKGRLSLIQYRNQEGKTIYATNFGLIDDQQDCLKWVFRNGCLIEDYSLTDVRNEIKYAT